MAMVVAGKLVIGRLYDMLGTIITLLVVCSGSFLSFIFLMQGNQVIPGLIYTLLSGLGATAITVTPSFLTAALFGEKEFGAKFGVISLFIYLGAAITPVVSGAIYNINHSYTLLLYILIILAFVELALFLLAIKTKPKFNSSC
ncbi:MFS transporter [Bacillus massilioanorexius]|uniref:MFS transporter n=2 Tax=Bacillus TaxID=1386 RepID=UPI0009DB6026|nr:MFS transporter [Bacillus massilioanorexius]